MGKHWLSRHVQFGFENRPAAGFGDEECPVVLAAKRHVGGMRLGAGADAVDPVAPGIRHPGRTHTDMRDEEPALRVEREPVRATPAAGELDVDTHLGDTAVGAKRYAPDAVTPCH